jgi:hypothetical protein
MPSLRPRIAGGDVEVRGGRVSVGPSKEKDGYLSAIVKWIPVEVLGFYEAITVPLGNSLAQGLWIAIAAGAIVTFLWIAFATKNSRKISSIAWRQALVSPAAFVFWVIGTTSPDVWKALFWWWRPEVNPAVLATGAVALPILDGILRRLGVPQD